MNGTFAMDVIRAMGIRRVASLVVSKPDSDFAMILGERCGRVVEGVCRPTGKSVPLGLLPEDGFVLTPFWMPPSVLLEDGFVLTPFWMPPSVPEWRQLTCGAWTEGVSIESYHRAGLCSSFARLKLTHQRFFLFARCTKGFL
jgi:hypothetical protein